MNTSVIGRIHSIQTLGTLDGPGVRFVVFMQGCNLRCKCCHNPDTWSMTDGKTYTAQQIVEKAERYREYFGKEGGITFSGGEPLLQADFVREVFALCHERCINTCLDTSGSILNEEVKALYMLTDRVLLDIKYTSEELYIENVGCSIKKPMETLAFLDKMHIPVTLRQVIIPTINDNAENIKKLNKIVKEHCCVDIIELLPFKKLCQMKYDKIGIEFPFAHLPEPSIELINELKNGFDCNYSLQ